MGGISVRLPAQVEQALDQEADLSQRNRSELVREAVGDYLDRRRFGAGALTRASEAELALVEQHASAVLGLWP